MKTRRKIIPGERFDRLVVIKKDSVHIKPCGTKQSKYLCVCDCGKYTSVLGQSLTNGNTKSCGCLSREIEWLQRAANHTKAMASKWSKCLCELPEND